MQKVEENDMLNKLKAIDKNVDKIGDSIDDFVSDLSSKIAFSHDSFDNHFFDEF